MKSLRLLLISLIVVSAAYWPNGPARADEWPVRPVKVIVPFAAGGSTDVVARLISERLAKAFGQPFVVENHAGAGGEIAAELVARAPADGYTLLVAALAQIAIIPAMRETKYDPVKDFAPISNIATNPYVLAVNSSLPVKSLADFVDYVRARPGKLAYASAGIGTQTHLTMALFLKTAGLSMIHVPYKGNAPAMSDLVADQVPAMFTNMSDALPQAAAGSIRLLAITSADRMAQVPNVPTAIESGYPNFKILTWNGLLAPAGTPQEITSKISAEVARIAKDPQVVERLASYGDVAVGDSPEHFASTIAADISLWKKAVEIAGVGEKDAGR